MDLTLYAESRWVSPWVLHAMAALEEKRLAYRLVVVDLPHPALAERAVIAKVPVLAHGDLWISESLAISEYLAETFPTPAHPRLFPADLGHRARARQLMLYLRTDTIALREARPTTTVFGPPPSPAAPLAGAAAAQAAELLRIADRLVDGEALFGAFSIADVDLALALQRLIRTAEPVPAHLVRYADAIFARASVQTFLRHRAEHADRA
jgi:glutathione S-transferase